MKTLRSQRAAIAASGLFDEAWYLRSYPEVAEQGLDPIRDYLTKGPRARNPGPDFNPEFYLKQNPDVANARVDPLLHYIFHGKSEGRRPRPPAAKVSRRERAALDLPNQPTILISGWPLEEPGFVYRVRRLEAAIHGMGSPAITLRKEEAPAYLNEIRTARAVFIWRAPLNYEIEHVLAEAKSNCVPVIYDLDDLVLRPEFATPKYLDSIRFATLDQRVAASEFASTGRAAAQADYCSASTEELAEHMRAVSGKRTFVIPNSFDEETYYFSRLSRQRKPDDGLIRLGYAAGTRTHQADFRQCAGAVAEMLRNHEQARLVLFRYADGRATLDISEFPELAGVTGQIEWREFVAHKDLPAEISRFDINLVPLEFGNPFVEAKSELKFFEAAICDVPTVSSPSGPFKRAIRNFETGILAATYADWCEALSALIDDGGLRQKIGNAAHQSVLQPFGPARRAELVGEMFAAVDGGEGR